MFNDLLDAYVNALVDTPAEALVPQYTCLLRDHLMKATLRRYMLALAPRLDAAAVAAAVAAGRAIAAEVRPRCPLLLQLRGLTPACCRSPRMPAA